MKKENKKEKLNVKKRNYFGAKKNKNNFAGGITKTMRTVLALDLGTTTGWAIANKFNIVSGSISFTQDRFSGGGMRYVNFQSWLRQLPRADMVYFEKRNEHLEVGSALTYEGLLRHLTSWCEMHNIPYQGIKSRSMKRLINGKVLPSLGNNEIDAVSLLNLAAQRKNQLKKNN